MKAVHEMTIEEAGVAFKNAVRNYGGATIQAIMRDSTPHPGDDAQFAHAKEAYRRSVSADFGAFNPSSSSEVEHHSG